MRLVPMLLSALLVGLAAAPGTHANHVASHPGCGGTVALGCTDCTSEYYYGYDGEKTQCLSQNFCLVFVDLVLVGDERNPGDVCIGGTLA